MAVQILTGDCREILRTRPDASVHCCVTSPPYYGLRDYDIPPTAWPAVEFQLLPGLPPVSVPPMTCCLGLEPDPLAFIGHTVLVFRDLRRVLRDDGTLWLNMGDSYAQTGGPGWQGKNGQRADRRFTAVRDTVPMREAGRRVHDGWKPKDLMGIPWMLAFALRADGWYLRQDIIWAKPNPMPESVRDRCTKAHEYLFLLSKSPRYYFDAEAIAESAITADEYAYAGDEPGLHSGESHAGSGKSTRRYKKGIAGWAHGDGNDHSALQHAQGERGQSHAEMVKIGAKGNRKTFRAGGAYTNNRSFDNDAAPCNDSIGNAPNIGLKRNKRSVWNIATQPFKEAHFATFPPDLVKPCIRAGTSEHGCCAKCGAPWRRITSKPFSAHDAETESAYVEGSNANRLARLRQAARERGEEYNAQRETLGWEPSCACGAGLVPCTILDPFGGVGTVGLVADRLQRNAVLIELNPEYADMARRRIHGDAPLLVEVAHG